jgi:hypothetical protein
MTIALGKTVTPITEVNGTGAAVQVGTIPAGRTPLTRGVLICALAANVGSVWIGDATVTTANGFELVKGASRLFEVSDPAQLFVVGAVGDKIHALLL